MTTSRSALLAAAALLAAGGVARAQTSNPGWFVPKQAAAPAPAGDAARHAHAARPTGPAPLTPAQMQQQEAEANAPASGPPPVLPLPPVPTPGVVGKGPAPPAAVIGVISVPDIMRTSLAAEQVQKVLGDRRDKLTQDIQKEQIVVRDMQQSLQDSRALTQDQFRARQRALQERVLTDQRVFKNRQRVIQEAAQVAINQIERELVQVIRTVAASRNMNLVLHQEQVALDVQGFDITDQVVGELNKVLPQVFIPAEGVDPEQLAKDGTFPTTAQPNAADLADGGHPIGPGAVQPVADPRGPGQRK